MVDNAKLGGRSRQVLDVIYRLGEVSAGEILEEVPELPSYSAVRSLLRALEEKGLITHREKGLKYVYSATVPRAAASHSALERVLDTFFAGSPEGALRALLDLSRDRDRDLDFDELGRMIDEARSREEGAS